MKLSDLHFKENEHEYSMEELSATIPTIIDGIRSRKVNLPDDLSMEGIFDVFKKMGQKMSDDSKAKKKAEKKKAIQAEYLFSSMRKHIKELINSVDEQKKPVKETVDLTERECRLLTTHDDKSTYMKELHKLMDILRDKNIVSPFVYLIEKKFPTLESIVNKNGFTAEGLVKTHDEILANGFLDADDFIKKFTHGDTLTKPSNNPNEVLLSSRQTYLADHYFLTKITKTKENLLTYVTIDLPQLQEKNADNTMHALDGAGCVKVLHELLAVCEEAMKSEEYYMEWIGIKYYDNANDIFTKFDKACDVLIKQDIKPEDKVKIRDVGMIIYGFLDADSIRELEPKDVVNYLILDGTKAVYHYVAACIDNLN